MTCWERFFRSAGVILLLVFLVSLAQAALPQVYAAAQESHCGDGVCDLCEHDTCREDCPPASTCGNGVCSTFENYQNCFLDCLPPSSTPTPTKTPTPTSTTILSSSTAAASPVDSAANTPLPEPILVSSTPTVRSTSMPVVDNSTPEPTSKPDSSCREVTIGEISKEAVDAFVVATGGILTDRWMICDTPPTKMCLSSVPADQSDLAAVHLLDCHRTGQCDVYSTARLGGGQVCVDLENVEQAPDCSEGCAWAVMEQDRTSMNLPGSVILVMIISSLMSVIAILHVSYPVPVDDESNSRADTVST